MYSEKKLWRRRKGEGAIIILSCLKLKRTLLDKVILVSVELFENKMIYENAMLPPR